MNFETFRRLYVQRYTESCEAKGAEAYLSWLSLLNMVDTYLIVHADTLKAHELFTTRMFHKHILVRVQEAQLKPVGPRNDSVPLLARPTTFIGVLYFYMLVMLLIGAYLFISGRG